MTDQKDNFKETGGETSARRGGLASGVSDTDWSYMSKKAEKLTTALYMVTDMMPTEEPMKWKAREFAVGLLSDIMLCGSSSLSERAELLKRVMKGVDHVVSYLEVAWTTRMMSEMNATILKKEYLDLKDVIVREWEQAARSGAVLAPAFFEVPRQLSERSTPEVAHAPEVKPSRLREGLTSGASSVAPTPREEARPQSPRPTPPPAVRPQTPIASKTTPEVKDTRAPATEVSPSPPREGLSLVPPASPSPRTAPAQSPQGQAQTQGRAFTLRGESRDGGRTFSFKSAPEVSPSSPREVDARSSGGEHLGVRADVRSGVGPTPQDLLRNSPSEAKENFQKVYSAGTAAPREEARPQSPRPTPTPSTTPNNNMQRDDRRKIILALVRQKPSLTVKDIAKSISGYSEKTIQRELLGMVAEGTLIKRGDRRWSTYSLPN